MPQRAHRPVRVAWGKLIPGPTTRLGIGGRGRALMRELARAVPVVVGEPTVVHNAAVARLTALAHLVRDRTREPFDLYRYVEVHGPYKPVPFTPAPFVLPSDLPERAVRAFPARAWLLMALLGVPAALLLLPGWSGIPGALLPLGTAIYCARAQRRARPDYQTRLEAFLREHHAQAAAAAEAAHRTSEAAKVERRTYEEGLRARLRESFGTRHPAAPLELLEQQLGLLNLPLPLIADVDMNGFEHVSVDVLLPELDDMPDDATTITHSGRLAKNRMDRAAKNALWDDACCGLALRVVHEVFRILPVVTRVTLRGLFATKDENREIDKVGLTLEIERPALAAISSPTMSSPDMVRAVGKWGGNRKGEIAVVL